MYLAVMYHVSGIFLYLSSFVSKYATVCIPECSTTSLIFNFWNQLLYCFSLNSLNYEPYLFVPGPIIGLLVPLSLWFVALL